MHGKILFFFLFPHGFTMEIRKEKNRINKYIKKWTIVILNLELHIRWAIFYTWYPIRIWLVQLAGGSEYSKLDTYHTDMSPISSPRLSREGDLSRGDHRDRTFHGLPSQAKSHVSPNMQNHETQQIKSETVQLNKSRALLAICFSTWFSRATPEDRKIYC